MNMDFPYSRQLNRPIRYFKYFTMADLFCVCMGTVVVLQVFGLTLLLVGFVLWFGYNLAFRIGRPSGYGGHYFKSLMRPECFTAGRGRHRQMVRRER
ncbi:MAG TPA: hypothetical protein VK785_08055 [Opitutaceae bacterium]|nr:hypothetical protein [Opitutaceae bacterium]